jgi:eukaryotic-like serine/threonine-protein kinase
VTERLDLSPDRWPDVSRVFSVAVGVEKSARTAYLDQACRDDSALRATVDSMLRAHDEAGSFGETPAFVPPGTVKRLAPDTQLGPFRIETLLGAGGMGEVYRAHDTKLQRAVAIKVLPDSFAHDADRRSRFEEEARALAALNHPHIGAIYGVEESEDVVALVLELVDGVTLDERLAAGPIPFDEIRRIARQLADGLEAAHDRGIVHRDFKPGNIKITPDGNVKILDFGLAKIDDSQIGAATVGSPSGSRHATQAGVVVGTAGYMSPEQARGLAVDKRTDIWAFGCVLFRMCARQPPFTGSTVTDALEAVIAGEPDWDLLPASTPPYLVRIVRRCLTKDPKLRLRDIGEARIALDLGDDADVAGIPTRARRSFVPIAAIATTIALAASLAFIMYRPTPSIAAVRFQVFPPEGGLFNFNPAQNILALSPDGSQLAFLASTESARRDSTASSGIWLRALTDLEPRRLQGTDGATSVFWSPTGRSLAFLADGKLKRFDLPTGPAVTLCDLPGATQGTWGAGDVILVGQSDGRAISAVPAAAAGGAPRTVLTPNRSMGDVRVEWPWFLPDGKRFLFTARRNDGEGELRIGQLDGSTRTVMRLSSNAQWVDPDVVVFAREGVLMAQRVDLKRAEPVGEAFSIADQVEYFFTTSRAMFSASQTGTIAYHPGGDQMQLVWADRNGNESGAVGKPANYNPESSRLSRDGRTLLTARRQPGLGAYDIWRRDLVRGTEAQLTFGRGSEVTPVWIDGERAIIFAGDSPGSLPHLFRRDLAAGTEEQILPAGSQQLVMDVLPGGRAVAYAERQVAGGFKLFQLPLTEGASPTPLLPPQFNSFAMRVSPDGRAIAFRAGPQGRELYVAPFPITSEPELAGTGIWSGPRWSADGRQLYYVGGDRRMMAVPVHTAPHISVGIAQQLFELKRSTSLLEVSHDGRFLLLVPQTRAAERPIIVDTTAIGSRRQ